MKHIMLDLETMSTSSNAAIVAIGAVEFDGNKLGEEFYARVSLDSSMQLGGEVSASTILWWTQQDEAARAEFREAKSHIRHALEDFEAFLHGVRDQDEVAMWGNGAAFDNVILANAYRRAGWNVPWAFWNDRCYRTLKAAYSVELPPREGTHHHALSDAKYQAQCANILIKQGAIKL